MEKTNEHPHDPKNNSFPKKEKLCSIKNIEELFKKGSSTFLYPFKLIHLHCEAPQQFPQVLISVPKKRFKKAVDRNKLKRQIREIYRLNKYGIFFDVPKERVPCFLGIIYVGKEKFDYKLLEKKLILILLRLKNT